MSESAAVLHRTYTRCALSIVFVLGCTVDRSGLRVDPTETDAGELDAGDDDAGRDATLDECPDDPEKEAPGVCGCGEPDTDTDGDMVEDCIDECPDDPAKSLPGVCGCGEPDIDADSDGFLACLECDDSNPMRFPDAPELCNRIDDDCDSDIDEDLDCDAGCADGIREGFLDLAEFPRVAACAGGWDIPGVVPAPAPACSRVAGNDSTNPNGTGCSAEDLCAEGWHLCASVAELSAALPSCNLLTTADAFFIAGVSGPGGRACSSDGRSNDIFGCGTIGRDMVDAATCGPLNRYDSGPCTPLGSPWNCGTSSSGFEANIVFKPGSSRGGVLCCR